MYKNLTVALLATSLLTACYVVPDRHDRDYGYTVAPALPVIVELGGEPYFYQSGYYYFYNNNSWSYSNAKTGPWRELPKDRYPREVRFHGRDRGHGDDHNRGPDGDDRYRN